MPRCWMLSIQTSSGFRRPSKKWKKRCGKGSVALMKDTIQQGCVSKDYPRRGFKFGIESHHHIFQRHMAPRNKSGKKWSIGRSHAKVWTSRGHPCAPKFEERTQDEPWNKKDAPEEKHWTWRKMSFSPEIRIKLRFIVLLKPGQCQRPLQNLQRNEISWLTLEPRCTCWTQRTQAQAKRKLFEDPGKHHNGGDGQWRSENERGSTRLRSRAWDLRDSANTRWHACRPVIRQALRRARIYPWVASGQKPHLTKDGKKFLRKTANFVPVVVPGLSSNSGASSSSTSLPQDSSRSSSPASFRSDEGVSGHWRNPPGIQNKK